MQPPRLPQRLQYFPLYRDGAADTYASARTILVFVTFSIVNFVFPPFPATLPIARERWSPFRGFTVGGNVQGTIIDSNGNTPVKVDLPGLLSEGSTW